MSRYQQGKTNLDFAEARDSEWQWHQLGWASTPPLSFLQAGCPPATQPTASKAQLNSKLHMLHITHICAAACMCRANVVAVGGNIE